jgi:chromosome segregation ATPase
MNDKLYYMIIIGIILVVFISCALLSYNGYVSHTVIKKLYEGIFREKENLIIERDEQIQHQGDQHVRATGELMNHLTTISSLEDKLAHIQSKLDDSYHSHEEIVNCLNNTIQQLRTEKMELDGIAHELRTEKMELEGITHQLRDESRGLECTIQQLREVKTGLERDLKNTNVHVLHGDNKITQLEIDNRQMTSMVEAADERARLLSLKLKSLEMKVHNFISSDD